MSVLFITRESVLSERRKLMADAEKNLRKIVSINVLYGGRMEKTEDRGLIIKYVAKLVRLNSVYTNRIYKIHKKIAKLERVLGGE